MLCSGTSGAPLSEADRTSLLWKIFCLRKRFRDSENIEQRKKNNETGAVLIKKIAIHIFLLQLKICTKIRGIFMLNPPYVKQEQEEN